MKTAAISVSNLTWLTPDGRRLFSDLSLTFSPRRAAIIGRNGVGKTTLLKLIAGDLIPPEGKIRVTGRLAFLRQNVQVAAHETVADLFGVTHEIAVLKRAEAGNAKAEEIADVDWSLEARLTSALEKVGLNVDPGTLLPTLSGGQRTRANLASVLFKHPDFLLLDEPTNNLDRDGRQAVHDLMENWRNGAIVVSHDRELLELVDETLELTSLGATIFSGNWSYYREQKDIELAAAQRDLETAEKRLGEVARKAQLTAEHKASRDRAGAKKRAKGDLPRILLGGRKDRAENTGGSTARLAEKQQNEAQNKIDEARERIEKLKPLTVKLSSSGLTANKTVLELNNVTAGYEPEKPVFQNLSFNISGPERGAITGANGAGKSTLFKIITGQLEPWSGSVNVVKNYVFLDQESRILDPSLSIYDNFARINPEVDSNSARAALARFKFRGDAALQIVENLSGGQTLLAGLACVLGAINPPMFLLLDEPTNHLDLEAVDALQTGLTAFDGALLIASHDENFLTEVGIAKRLELKPGFTKD